MENKSPLIDKDLNLNMIYRRTDDDQTLAELRGDDEDLEF